MAASSSISALPTSSCLSKESTWISSVRSVSYFIQRTSFASLKLKPLGLQVPSASNRRVIRDVIETVKEQLGVEDEFVVTGATKFSELGADSLGVVDLVLAIEKKYGITVANDEAFETVQDAIELVEKSEDF